MIERGPLKILVAAVGSHGDVLPFIALSRALQARGQDVVLYASGYFAPYAVQAGVRLRPLGTAAEHAELLRDPDLAHPIRGHGAIAAALERVLPTLYEALRADVDPGRTLVVGSILAFPALLLRETAGVPCVLVHLSPTTLRSSFEVPRMTAVDFGPLLPRWTRTLLYRAVDRWALDPLYGGPINRYRQTLGLGPVRGVLSRWLNDADLQLAMFPDWFAEPQPDWPARLRQTGFPLYDEGPRDEDGPRETAGGRAEAAPPPLRKDVRAFLAAGTAPIAFTAGTATASATEFYRASIDACHRGGHRGILLAHRPEQIPAPLPPGVAHFGYVPFGALLPEVVAFVHHGGIGTTSQALRAGVPQLVRPMAYDQLDNSRRVGRLGVAAELLPARYDGRSAARKLDELIRDSQLRERCRHWATRLADADSDAVGRSSQIILDEFLPGGRTSVLARAPGSVAT